MVAAFFLFTMLRSLWGRKQDMIISADLFGKFSYRYGEQQKKSIAFVFMLFKRSLKCLWKPVLQNEIDTSAAILVFDGKNEFQTRQRYLQYIMEEPYGYAWRQTLTGALSFPAKLGFSVFLSSIFPLLLLVALFRRDKASVGLVLLELTEFKLLAQSLRNLPAVQKVIIFSAFEKDVTFIAAYLSARQGLSVQLVPSSNPLKNFYSRGVCSIFTFTAAFHKKEFETLKHNWIYQHTVNWPPFGYEEVLPRLSTYKVPAPKTIGLFSSGNWMREREGHVSIGLNERQAEKQLQNCLKNFLQSNPSYHLTIFLHPLEKKNDQSLNESRKFYYGLFGETISFAPLAQNSVANFDLVELGISVYSSTVFQRLFAGMKACFAPFGMPYNYFNDKRLENISIRKENEFSKMILDLVEMNTGLFFEHFCLNDYHIKSYGPFVQPGKQG